MSEKHKVVVDMNGPREVEIPDLVGMGFARREIRELEEKEKAKARAQQPNQMIDDDIDSDEYFGDDDSEDNEDD